MAESALANRPAEIAIPPAGEWMLDAAHTSVTVVARHVMIAKVRGHFSDVSGKVVIEARPEKSAVEISIPAATIDTGNEMRDNHLRSPDFLDVESHPTITFRSTRLEPTGETSFRLHGDLTIRGVTKPMTLEVTYEGLATDPFGNERAAFSATGDIDRGDWDMTWNQTLETGGVLVGRRLRVELDVQIVKR